ncbi:hypothetical protein ACFYW9_19245 [Streptomyces sp. NPDC002698]|uniref:hypothetical protein n=1 Tax=Streptomyces sp. NPDC002698 TaxID=3364660 RepID=UPI0036760175
MDLTNMFEYAGMASTAIAALVLIKAAWRLNTAQVWKEEAEAQRTRADRLLDELSDIKDRLTRIEDENKRLVELLKALDPERINSLRL